MQIGIGLPATIPGATPSLILNWARRAEAQSFSSLGIIDRLVYLNYAPLITLAAVACSTRHIRLMTTILLAPLRGTGLVAKQAASLDALSDGRLTLGLAVGTREDDYTAAPASFHDRGRRFDEQLATMKRIWSGAPAGAGIGPIGPAPVQRGGPELLIGGASAAVAPRVARWADGFIASGGDPAAARRTFESVVAAWSAAGRAGRPRFVGAFYYALGPNAAARASCYIHNYYAFAGPVATRIASAVPTSPAAVADLIHGFRSVGMDELILWPCIPELEQVDRLREAAR